MGRLRRSRKHHAHKLQKLQKTKRKKRDLDQIYEDLQPEEVKKFTSLEVDLDLPGQGQFYCISCSRYFITNKVLIEHFQTKLHKKRVKQLKEKPYTGPDILIDNGKPLNRNPVPIPAPMDNVTSTENQTPIDNLNPYKQSNSDPIVIQ